MTIVEYNGTYPWHLTFVDGFIPPESRLREIVQESPFVEKDERLERYNRTEITELYADTIGALTRFKYNSKPYIVSAIEANIFMLAPLGRKQQRKATNPILTEHRRLSERRDDYRMTCFLISEEVGERLGKNLLEKCYLPALQEMGFEIRHDGTYSDLERFRNFLNDEVADEILEPYAMPWEVAIRRSKRLGMNVGHSFVG